MIMDIDHRVASLENLVERMSDDLQEIRSDVKSLIAVKIKLESIDAIFRKIEDSSNKSHEMELKFSALISEHNRCLSDRTEGEAQICGINLRVSKLENQITSIQTEHDSCKRLQTKGIDFVLGRAGSVFDMLLKIMILGGFAYMLLFKRGMP